MYKMKPNKIAILVNMDARQGLAGKLWKKINHDVMELFPGNTEIVAYNIPCNIEKVIQDLIINKRLMDLFLQVGMVV